MSKDSSTIQSELEPIHLFYYLVLESRLLLLFVLLFYYSVLEP